MLVTIDRSGFRRLVPPRLPASAREVRSAAEVQAAIREPAAWARFFLPTAWFRHPQRSGPMARVGAQWVAVAPLHPQTLCRPHQAWELRTISLAMGVEVAEAVWAVRSTQAP